MLTIVLLVKSLSSAYYLTSKSYHDNHVVVAYSDNFLGLVRTYIIFGFDFL